MKSFLTDIITRAGEISLDYKARLHEVRVDRKNKRDLVTEADVAVEKYLVAQIKTRYPDHAILGEETGTHAGGDTRWIIDPIDGTASFVHDLPFYSVSLALEHRGEVILGAVNAPVLGELFIAEKGKGAALNGQPIHVSDCGTLSDAMLGTGFACMRDDSVPNNLTHFAAITPLIMGVRRHGSAAVDLCYVACGRFDGFWELQLKTYDIAAGVLIAAEAGATVTDFSGERADNLPGEIIATNGKIHRQLAERLSTQSP
ncbi:MAG: inositol monophosphatase family protein [Planctomycetota bacterium]